jgi:transglutaminase-like putative cysteine protease
MKSGRLFKKIILTVLIVAALLTFAACSTGDATARAEDALAAHAQEAQVVTIESDPVPLAAQKDIATAEATFNDGGSVNTTSLQNGSITLNTNLAEKGIVGIQADVQSDKRLKVKVALDEQAEYYDITKGEMTKVPMQFGSGTYRVAVFENISGNEYTGLYEEDVDVSLGDANDPFLYSSQIVDYEDSKDCYPLAEQLAQGAGSDMDILTAYYGYVVSNITYDYDKINRIDSTYVPDIDDILKSKKGICYDYAAVLASLLREAGIPTKLVMGYRSDMEEYHAWNQVLIGGEWITVDATFGSVMQGNGQSDDMVKEAALYSAEKVF